MEKLKKNRKVRDCIIKSLKKRRIKQNILLDQDQVERIYMSLCLSCKMLHVDLFLHGSYSHAKNQSYRLMISSKNIRHQKRLKSSSTLTYDSSARS